jgi:hypothetical protein
VNQQRVEIIHNNEYSFKGPLFKGIKYEALTRTSSEGRVIGDKEAKLKKKRCVSDPIQ